MEITNKEKSRKEKRGVCVLGPFPRTRIQNGNLVISLTNVKMELCPIKQWPEHYKWML